MQKDVRKQSLEYEKVVKELCKTTQMFSSFLQKKRTAFNNGHFGSPHTLLGPIYMSLVYPQSLDPA